MTINEAYIFVNFICNKKQRGYVTPDNFNNLAPIMQMSLINDRIGNIKKYPFQYGFGQTQKIREELRPLLVKPTVTAVTTGVAPFPADYIYYDTISVSGRQGQEVTEDEILELSNSLIKPPTLQYPKFVLHSNGINMYPVSITSILLSYLRKPATPLWNYDMVNDEPVYKVAGSQDFETHLTTHFEICARILQAVGLNLGENEITQWSEMAEATGK